MVATIITSYLLLKSGRSPGPHRWGFFCKRAFPFGLGRMLHSRQARYRLGRIALTPSSC